MMPLTKACDAPTTTSDAPNTTMTSDAPTTTPLEKAQTVAVTRLGIRIYAPKVAESSAG